MLRVYSRTAGHICKIRWDFVKEIDPKSVLDYGSGCGFFKAFAPQGILVDTYDIMPVPITGINQDRYDLVTFWDVLEHIPDFSVIVPVLSLCDHVAITVPVKPDDMEWKDFKHYKPLEHIHHFTDDSLISLMETFGFKLIKAATPECPPREYIHSFLFKKDDNAKTYTR
jgi:hypothetical protein